MEDECKEVVVERDAADTVSSAATAASFDALNPSSSSSPPFNDRI